MRSQIPGQADRSVDAETGRAAAGTRGGAPAWLTLLLAIVAAFLAFWAFFRSDLSWSSWVILAGIVVVVAGAMIALNPRRGSPSGGTRAR